MMDLTSLIEIVFVVAAAYLLIKFIISPIIRIIIGIIAVIFLVYLLQHFFGFDLSKVLSPFGISLDTGKLGTSFNWILTPINYYIEKIINFFNFALKNVPKNTLIK